MSIESTIGIAYVLIGVVHLAVLTARASRKRYLRTNFMGPFMATYAWPVTDALWLINRRRRRAQSKKETTT